MTPEARAIGSALLAWRREAIAQHPPGSSNNTKPYVIRYQALCERAGVPSWYRNPGRFLGEIAEWCEAEGFPPLNALAVGDGGYPGHGYDGAGGFAMADWPRDVKACIQCTRYPTEMPPA